MNSKMIIFMASLFLTACVGGREIKEGNIWNMEEVIQLEQSAVLSELSDSLVCVPLETNDSSLLDDGAHVIYADESDLFIRSADKVYRFASDGQFLNKIGVRGNGPGEYAMLYSVSVDKLNKCLLFYVGQKRILQWKYDGTFQKEIVLCDAGETTALCLWGENRILSENRFYSDRGLKTNLHFLDLDGSLLKGVFLYEDKLEVNQSMQTVPLMYKYHDVVKYKDWNSNALYAFDGKEADLEYVFDFGKYTPSRELLEDVSRKHTLLKEYVQLVDMKESRTRFYVLLVHEGGLKGIIMDKHKRKLLYNQTIGMPQRGGGIVNDYLFESFFWPSFIDDKNVMYGLTAAEHVNHSGGTSMQKGNLPDHSFSDEDNPVLLKVYGK